MNIESSVNIIKEICQLMAEGGGDCTQWCVGAGADGERRLFEEHGISRNHRWHICRRAESAEEARAIVRGFLNLSCDECRNGLAGDEAVYVYAYLKAPQPEPAAGNGHART